MDATIVACAPGHFPLPAPWKNDVQNDASVHDDSAITTRCILEPLQGLVAAVGVQLTCLSAAWENDGEVAGRSAALLDEVAAELLRALRFAADAQHPILTASTQHASVWCKLLEQSHLLDRLVTRRLHGENTSNSSSSSSGGGSFLALLERRITLVPCADSVLAALVQHCQLVVAAGTSLHVTSAAPPGATGGTAAKQQGALDTACLSAALEQHSAARALPLLLRMYCTSAAHAEALAAGRPELLGGKLMERCLALLAARPVVPGHADQPVWLPGELDGCVALAELAAARRLKLPSDALVTETKAAARLEASYSLSSRSATALLSRHDELCDRLAALALELQQALASERDIDTQAFGDAEALVVDAVQFVAAARGALLELDAWRTHNARRAGAGAAKPCDLERCALAADDAVPALNVIAAAKGVAALVAECDGWLQPLLRAHAAQQLSGFVGSTLPALARMFPRNERVQALAHAAAAAATGQLSSDAADELLFGGGGADSHSHELVSDAGDVLHGSCAPQMAEGLGVDGACDSHAVCGGDAPGPIAEGLEGLRLGRWGSARSAGASATIGGELVSGDEHADDGAGGDSANEQPSGSKGRSPAQQRWRAGVIQAMRGVGRGGAADAPQARPESSPHPHLCSAPAALAAAHAVLAATGVEASAEDEDGSVDDGVTAAGCSPHAISRASRLAAAAAAAAELDAITAAAGLADGQGADALGCAAAAAADLERGGSHGERRPQLLKFLSILHHHESLSTRGRGAAGTAATCAAAQPASGGGASAAIGAAGKDEGLEGDDDGATAEAAAAAGYTAVCHNVMRDEEECSSSLAAATSGPLPCGREGGLDSAKPSRIAGLVGFVMGGMRPGGREAAGAAGAAPPGPSHISRALTFSRRPLFAAKIRKVLTDRRHAHDDASVVDDAAPAQPVLLELPPAHCLPVLRALLEALASEVKAETKRHLVAQLKAATAAAGVAKPDAAVARPLQQAKAMAVAVARVQLVLDAPATLTRAADLSGLWLQTASSADSHARRSKGSSSSGVGGFALALLRAGVARLEQLPAELPLLALQLLWDGRAALDAAGILDAAAVAALREEEATCLGQYVHLLLPRLHEHFKTLAAQQTLSHELLASCGTGAELPAVQRLWLDALLREPCELLVQGRYAVHAPVQLPADDGCCRGDGGAKGGAGGGGGHHSHDELQREAQRLLGEMRDALEQLHCDDHHRQAADVSAESEGLCHSASVGREQQLLNHMGDPRPLPALPECAGGADTAAATATEYVVGSCSLERGSALQQQQQGGAAGHAMACSGNGSGAAVADAPAGESPLMRHLAERQAVRRAADDAAGSRLEQLLVARSATLVDVRAWLLQGLEMQLAADACALAQEARRSPPSAIVQVACCATVLRRTHELLAQHAPLSSSWPQLWNVVDGAHDDEGAAAVEEQGAGSAGVPQEAPGGDQASSDLGAALGALVSGAAALPGGAVYDNEAQVLLPSPGVSWGDAVAAVVVDNGNSVGCVVGFGGGAGRDAHPHPAAAAGGTLAVVKAALAPLRRFFGRQHLAALQELGGDAAVAALLRGLLLELESSQGELLLRLARLSPHLPEALARLPPAERCSGAEDVLRFYAAALGGVLDDSAGCAAALRCLQRIGNTLALLQLLAVQQGAASTPLFMAAAPLLGVVARPLGDAAAADECFEGGGPAGSDAAGVLPPPAAAPGAGGMSCVAGLLMPEVEVLVPSDAAHSAHELQTALEVQQDALTHPQPLGRLGGELARHRMWQASHFQRQLLGPNAEMVRGPALLLAQAAELRTWRATRGEELLEPCMQALQGWAMRLQSGLQGMPLLQEDGGGAAGGGDDDVKEESPSLWRQPAPPPAVVAPAEYSYHHTVEQQQQLVSVTADYQQQCTTGSGQAPPHHVPDAAAQAEELMQEEAHLGLAECGVGGVNIQAVPNAVLVDCCEQQRMQQEEEEEEAQGGGHTRHSAKARRKGRRTPRSAGKAAQQQQQKASTTASTQCSPRRAAVQYEDPTVRRCDAGDGGLATSDAVPLAQAKLASRSVLEGDQAVLLAKAGEELPSRSGHNPRSPCSSSPRVMNNNSTSQSRLVGGHDGADDATSVSDVDSDSGTAAPAAAGVPRPSSRQALQSPLSSPRRSRLAHESGGGGGGGGGCGGAGRDDTANDSAGMAQADGGASPPEGRVPPLSLSQVHASDTQAGDHTTHAPASARGGGGGGGDGGGYPAPPVNELLYDTTCVELVRVKEQNDVLRSELEVMRMQLYSRDAALALLSGNLYTPRPSDLDATDGGGAGAGGASPPRPGSRATGRGSAHVTPRVTPRAARAPGVAEAVDHTAASMAVAATAPATSAPLPPLAADDGSCIPPQAQVPLGMSACRPETRALGPHQPDPLCYGYGNASIIIKDASNNTGCAGGDGAGGHDERQMRGARSDGGVASGPASRRLQLPVCVPAASRPGSQAAGDQLAVVLSALKLALLLGIAQAGVAGSDGGASDAPVSADGGGGVGGGGCESRPGVPTPSAASSPLKRLKRAALAVVALGGAAASSSDTSAAPGLSTGVQQQQQQQQQQTLSSPLQGCPGTSGVPARCTTTAQPTAGSGRVAGGCYGDGPLLASGVLLQLSGQSRQHALLDACRRVVHWAEFDAALVAAGAAGGAEAGEACSTAPVPRSRRAQEEAAEAAAAAAAAAAAQRALLLRLVAVAREAERVLADGSSLAARFAPPPPTAGQQVRVRAPRADVAAAAEAAAAAVAVVQPSSGRRDAADSLSGARLSSTGGAPAGRPAVLAVPVSPVVLEYTPRPALRAGLEPRERPIQGHPALPMQRPRPLLLQSQGAAPCPAAAAASAGATRLAAAAAAAAVEGRSSAVAAAAVASAAAGAAPGVLGPDGRLRPGVGVAPAAGVLAAARAVAARDALASVLPRAAVCEHSVVSDHNRSGRPEDGYSCTQRAPSSSGEPGDGSPTREEGSPRRAARWAAGRLVTAGDALPWTGIGFTRGPGDRSPSPTKSPARASARKREGGLAAVH